MKRIERKAVGFVAAALVKRVSADAWPSWLDGSFAAAVAKAFSSFAYAYAVSFVGAEDSALE